MVDVAICFTGARFCRIRKRVPHCTCALDAAIIMPHEIFFRSGTAVFEEANKICLRHLKQHYSSADILFFYPDRPLVMQGA